ncbi:hypothetical protein TREVI0001_0169 [Treponema vincentii ATCC 35580]|uniref:Uncharacterized protein n=1 Tax=Treponema vincentii ATCC 35580 TaxID=596324 RepID=C8PTM9_9SPIR|nr:hypothetical protein TREVI0001_0169 [Treponema vincentii ATCC 35580]
MPDSEKRHHNNTKYLFRQSAAKAADESALLQDAFYPVCSSLGLSRIQVGNIQFGRQRTLYCCRYRNVYGRR